MSDRFFHLSRRFSVALVMCAGTLAVPAHADEVVFEEMLPHTQLMARPMPCAQRVGTLEINLPRRSYLAPHPQVLAREQELGAEAILQLAMLSFKGECGVRRDEAPLRTLAARGDARGVAALRVLTATSPLDRAVSQVRAEDLPRLQGLPKPNLVATLAGPVTRKCTAPSTSKLAEGELPASRTTAPLQVLAYWAQSHLGNEALCEGRSPDPQTRAYFYDWPHVVSIWQAAAGRTPTGELARSDVDDLYRRIDVAAAGIERERLDLQLAQARQVQQEQAAMKERAQREAASEREFKSFLSKSGNPQQIYLQAGKYERAAEPLRAKRLYEFVIDSFPKTQWAVSSNDRLLQMRSEEQSRASTASRPPPAGKQGTARQGGYFEDPMTQIRENARSQQEESARQERERAAEFQRVQESQRRAWELQQQMERERQQQIERNSR